MTKAKLLVHFIVILNIVSPTCQNHRQRRFFLVPPLDPTRYQFIIGLGIPIDLEDQEIVTGYALRMQGIIPYEIEHLYPDYFTFDEHSRNKRTATNTTSAESEMKSVRRQQQVVNSSHTEQRNIQYDNEIKYSRWRIYRVIEGILNHRKMEGKQCLMRTICEVSMMKITQESGLLGEIVNIILTIVFVYLYSRPSSSSEPTEYAEHLEYYAAEEVGRKREQECAQVYGICKMSLMDMFSEILEVIL